MRARRQKITHPDQSSFTYRQKSVARLPFDWHFHPEHELTLITRSSGTRYVGDASEEYDDGDLVLLGPNLPHTWDSTTSRRAIRQHRAVFAQFGADFLGERFLAAPELRSVAQLLERSARGLVFSGESARRSSAQLLAMAELSGLDRLVALLAVLERLARDGEARAIVSEGYSPPRRDEHRRIDRVIRFVHDRVRGELAQTAVAEFAGLSPAAFSRFFRRAVGKTFVEYVGEVRIGHAARLLIETDLSVLDIAYESGFRNLSNFNRRFRRLKGKSPREFRQLHDSISLSGHGSAAARGPHRDQEPPSGQEECER